MNKCVFFDRDGTINVDYGYVYKTEDFVFRKNFIEALRILKAEKYLVIVITNQSGIAKGFYNENDVIKLHHYINHALKRKGVFIDDFYYNKEQKEQFNSKRNNILKVILVYLKKYQKRLQNINKKLKECESKETYQLYGELITSNLYRIKNTNEDKIQLENYYDNNNLITIPLDKKYSVANNAKRYFKKYNKLKNALEICAIQKKETELELDYIESVVYELESSTTLADLEQIYAEISESSIFKDSFNKSKNKKKKQNVPSSIQPVQLHIDGFIVYVGKNNICNDYLTTKLANKNDLWFHTKDIHGSHVVLNLENKTPNNGILQKCAELAAYHSKAKLSSNVPVDYCYIKYVKKPSKSKAGMVIYTHNKTLFVNPKKY